MSESIRRITNRDDLKGLTHPLRLEALRLLTQFGPSTTTALAARTGSDPGRMSYHLRQLAKRGFVRPAPEFAHDRRESWWRIIEDDFSFSVEAMGDPGGRAIARSLRNMIVAEELERLAAFDAARSSWSPEWIGATQTSNTFIRLAPGELQELGDKLNAVIRSFRDADPQRAAGALAPDRRDDGRESVFVFFHAFPERQ